MYSVRTPHELASKGHDGPPVILQLPPEIATRPASLFGLRQMLAYRLVIKPRKKTVFLPTLALEHDQRCPLCKGDESSSQRLDPFETESLIGPNPRELYTMSEGQLMRLPGGIFWTALARMAPTEQPASIDVKEYPDRERKQVERNDYLDSTQAIPGSSSPILQLSSSFEVDTNDVDEDEHENRRAKPEDMTVHLVNCFLQYVLSFCLLQHPVEYDVRPRVQRMSTKVRVGEDIIISAEDDGGICRMRREDSGWEMHHSCLALIEAKRAFKHIYFDERTNSYEPVMSNEHLAQCFGEAVITWKGNHKLLGDEYVGLVLSTSRTTSMTDTRSPRQRLCHRGNEYVFAILSFSIRPCLYAVP